MAERLRRIWTGFSDTYAPAIVGGIFLCLADLLQNKANGQLGKLGSVIGPPFRLQLENELIGLLVILVLGCLLCWVFRPTNRGESFSRGASVFAVLAALVPAGVTPGGLSSSTPVRPPQPDKDTVSIIGSAHAQTVIPLTPTGKLLVRIVGGEGVTDEDIQSSISKEGVSVSLLEPDSKRKIGFDKLWASRFEIVRPPAKYLMELEVGGFERVRGEIEIASETKVIDVKIDKRSALPLGIQRIFSAAPLAFGVNERETLIERGKDAARRGQYVAAVNLYDKALAMDAKDKQTLNYKGYALFRLGKLDDAYKVLTASRQIDADYFLARLNLAKVACRLGRTKEATDALAGGNALTPRQARVVLQDGEYLLVCKTAPEVIKNLASKN
jgi:hypothetical protein